VAYLLEIAGWIAVATGLCGACYAVAAAVAVRNFARKPAPLPQSVFPALTLLKPLYGAEPGLEQDLESFCEQKYPGPIQLLFGVHDPEDQAASVIADLKKHHPDLDIALITGTNRDAPNPKIANLIEMIPHAKHNVLVLSDSDIGVPADYAAKLAGALEPPNVGAVTCCYTGRALAANLWSHLSAMGINYHFLPNVLFGVSIGLASPCFGSTIALKRSVLDEIGSFRAFSDRLADDYEIGRAVRAHGYRVALPPLIVAHACTETSAAELFRHELRWARTIRGIDPLGFFGTILTHTVPLSLIGAILLAFSLPAALALAAALAARLWLKSRIDRVFGCRSRTWLIVFRDLLSFVVFIGALFTKNVEWRGVRYQVNSAGVLARDV
jgi:ceramide glucosyltransferase